MIQQIAPAPLAQAAATLAMKGSAAWQHAIEDFWHGEPEVAGGVDDTAQAQSANRVLAWMFLQPYAEYLADHREIAGGVSIAVMWTCLVSLLVLLGSATLARRALDRRRLSAWEAEWRASGPLWSGHHS